MKTMIKFITLFVLAFCFNNAIQAEVGNCNAEEAFNNQKIDQLSQMNGRISLDWL